MELEAKGHGRGGGGLETAPIPTCNALYNR